MRIPQMIIGVGLVVLAVLFVTPQRHLPRYDSATEVTVRGTVTDVREFYCPISGHEGTHLAVATDNGVVEVHVAPTQFLSGRKWEFFRGDQVEVSGSLVMYHGHETLIARTVARGNQTVALRNASGKPLWTE